MLWRMFTFLSPVSDLCSEIGDENIKVIFRNTLSYPIDLYKKNEDGDEYVPKDFEPGQDLTIEAPQETKWIFKSQNEGKHLSGCVRGEIVDMFKGSDLGITCSRAVLVTIFGGKMSLIT